MKSTRALMDKLVELGATLRAPASEDAIMKVEQLLQSRFPEGIRHFYKSCDGVEDATSEWIWDFFSLDRMIDRTVDRRKQGYLLIDKAQKLSYGNLVCFCDVLIDAPTYLFCSDPNSSSFGHFYADQGYDGWLVADSYEKFVDVFLSQNGDILLNV